MIQNVWAHFVEGANVTLFLYSHEVDGESEFSYLGGWVNIFRTIFSADHVGLPGNETDEEV